MNILYNTLKSGGTKDHFRQVKVPGTAPYWKAYTSGTYDVFVGIHHNCFL